MRKVTYTCHNQPKVRDHQYVFLILSNVHDSGSTVPLPLHATLILHFNLHVFGSILLTVLNQSIIPILSCLCYFL